MAGMNRRSFLKLSGAAAGALVAWRTGLVAFDEPVIASPYAKWISDKGDWYEVFVPDGETLVGENFDKRKAGLALLVGVKR